jgi:hypothetical protein
VGFKSVFEGLKKTMRYEKNVERNVMSIIRERENIKGKKLREMQRQNIT